MLLVQEKNSNNNKGNVTKKKRKKRGVRSTLVVLICVGLLFTMYHINDSSCIFIRFLLKLWVIRIPEAFVLGETL